VIEVTTLKLLLDGQSLAGHPGLLPGGEPGALEARLGGDLGTLFVLSFRAHRDRSGTHDFSRVC
jgi:hypothetical protein